MEAGEIDERGCRVEASRNPDGAGQSCVSPPECRTRLTDATLSRRAFLSRETAALIMFLCSSLGVVGGSSDSFLHTSRMACSLYDQDLEYAPAT